MDEHPVQELTGFNVEWNELLWKYITTDRFVTAIETGMLHFASANQFADSFEGAVAVQMHEPPTDPRYDDMERSERAFFELKRLTKISCWHRAAYESDAMWKLYAGQHKGVAICTTPERMRAAFKPFRLEPEYELEPLWCAPVTYVDLTQVRMKRIGMLDRFFYKHRAFEWEQEFRLAISLRMAEEFGVQVPANGILVEVNLDVLIERVVLGSTISQEERKIVAMRLEEAGFLQMLHKSTLLGRPRYI